MRVNRTVMMAVLVGIAAGTAYGQTGPPGQPGTQGQYDNHRRGSGGREYDRYYDRYYDPQPYYGYERDRAPDADVGFFYNELSPYGEWLRHPRYGWVWLPRYVRAGWRPYTLGRWVGSDYGWMWDSFEPFGWATYHYGRWAWDPYIGWLWVPGTDWGPAWVAWQQGNGYVGWAPLPPTVGFQIGIGLRFGGFNLSAGIPAHDYSFVEEGRFLDNRIGNSIVPQARNSGIINRTKDITNYTVTKDRVINHGVAIDRIERATGKSAPRFRITTASEPEAAGRQRDVISVYRPPKSSLETVKIGQRNNAGLPQAGQLPDRTEKQAPTDRSREVAPIPKENARVPIPVAPPTRLAPRGNEESQFVREQRDLKAAQEKERRALEKVQRRDMMQPQARANPHEVAQRHAAEIQAQKEQQQVAKQQLKTQQLIRRQAAEARAEQAKPDKDKK